MERSINNTTVAKIKSCFVLIPMMYHMPLSTILSLLHWSGWTQSPVVIFFCSGASTNQITNKEHHEQFVQISAHLSSRTHHSHSIIQINKDICNYGLHPELQISCYVVAAAACGCSQSCVESRRASSVHQQAASYPRPNVRSCSRHLASPILTFAHLSHGSLTTYKVTASFLITLYIYDVSEKSVVSVKMTHVVRIFFLRRWHFWLEFCTTRCSHLSTHLL